MLKVILFSFLVIICSCIGGCYYAVYHSNIPLSIVTGILESAGAEIEGAEGSISNGFKIEKMTFPVSNHSDKKNVIEGLEFTYENFFDGLNSNEFVINNITLSKCHVYFNSSDNTTQTDSDVEFEVKTDDSDASTSENEPFRFLLKNVTIKNCIAESLNESTLFNLDLFQLKDLEISNKSLKLDRLEISEGTIKRKGENTSEIKKCIIDKLHFHDESFELNEILVDCSSFAFSCARENDSWVVKSKLEPKFDSSIKQTILLNAKGHLIPLESEGMKYQLQFKGHLMDGNFDVDLGEVWNASFSEINIEKYLNNLTPISKFSFDADSIKEELVGHVFIGQEMFIFEKEDKENNSITLKNHDQQMTLTLSGGDDFEFDYKLESKNKKSLKDLLAQCYFNKNMKDLKEDSQKKKVNQLVTFFK